MKPLVALPMSLLHEAIPVPSLIPSQAEVVVLYSHNVCMPMPGIPWPSLVILPYTVTVLFWAGEGLSTHAVTRMAAGAGVAEGSVARVRVGATLVDVNANVGVTFVGVRVSTTVGDCVGSDRVRVAVGKDVGLSVAVEPSVGG